MRLKSLGTYVFALVLVPSCSSKSTSGSCKGNSDCDPGEVCSAGECLKICAVQRDCDAGQLCQDSVCVTPTGDSLPTITSVVGNDAADATRVIDGVLVTGVLLADADFELRGATSDVPLLVRSQSAVAAELILSEDVVSGSYLLVATNLAGSDQAEVTLTLPEVTGTMIITKVNSPETTGSFAVNHLPIGSSATEIAAGDHRHETLYAPAGHDHGSLYSTLGHSHDADYVNVTGDTMSGDLSVAGNVGIGTTTPVTALDVAGEVRIASTGLACDATNEGALRYDSTSKTILICDGTAWRIPPGTVTGGCTFGAGWGTATACPLAAGITCSAGNTPRVFTWCATSGTCNWNSAGSYAHGVCIKD
ncbi:hypothetical protein ACFL6C_00775 [Myxococcota bacterium]